MILGEPILLGGKGETASIFVTGLTETDDVTASKDGKTWNGVWTDKHILPSGYTEVEYIESDGNAYIDTGITSGNGFAIETKIRVPSSGWSGISGYNASSNECFIGTQNGKLAGWFMNSRISDSNIPISTTTSSTLKVKVITGSQQIWVDGESKFTSSVSSLANYHIYINAVTNYDATSGESSKLIGSNQYYTFDVYDSTDTLVRSFIPCKTTSNVYGMYDLVSNTFFGNSGTGAFTGGQEVHHYGHLISKLNSYGTYTVTATDGTHTATQDVLVDMATEFDIEMAYIEKLYWLGDTCDDVTGGWKKGYFAYDAVPDIVFNNDNMYMPATSSMWAGCLTTRNSIDVTDYNYLKFEVEVISGAFWTQAYPYLTGDWVEINGTSPIVVIADGSIPSGINTYSVDISALSGNYYPVINSYQNSYKTYKVWLE